MALPIPAHAMAVEDLDPVSKRILPVLRHLVHAWQEPHKRCWVQGYASAAEIWGEARGLAIAHRVQAFVCALLKSRPVPLRVQDPSDLDARVTLTEDECVILALLTHMRSEATADARNALASLTGGRVEAAAVRAGLDLCAALDGQPSRARSQQRPMLQVVR